LIGEELLQSIRRKFPGFDQSTATTAMFCHCFAVPLPTSQTPKRHPKGFRLTVIQLSLLSINFPKNAGKPINDVSTQEGIRVRESQVGKRI
jgi:hypothetical protein